MTLRRRSPLPRSSRPMKKTRLNPVNRKRKAKRLETDFGGRRYAEFISGLECAVCGAYCEWTVPAHLTSRGAGGKADVIVPLCAARFGINGCHERYDNHDEEIRAHEPRLRTLAKRLRNEFLTRTEDAEC